MLNRMDESWVLSISSQIIVIRAPVVFHAEKLAHLGLLTKLWGAILSSLKEWEQPSYAAPEWQSRVPPHRKHQHQLPILD